MHLNDSRGKERENMEGIVAVQQFYVDSLILEEEAFSREYFRMHPDLKLDKPCVPETIDDMRMDPTSPYSRDKDYLWEYDTATIGDYILNLRHTDIYARIAANYMPPVMHDHTYIEIVYLLEGGCVHYSGNQILHLEKGDVLILAPNTIHAISAFNDECRLVNVMIRSSIFHSTFFGSFEEDDILYRFFHTVLYKYEINSYLLFRTRKDEFLRGVILQILNESAHRHSHGEKIKTALVQTFFIQILNRHAVSAVVYNDGVHAENQDVTLMLSYMQKHCDSLTLRELAAFFGYSERQISRILLKYTKENYRENMNHIKMRKAKQLLEESSLSIDAVAGMMGYSTAYGFRKLFKEEFSITPSEYRKTVQR